MNKREYYEIRVECHLGSNWAHWFEGLSIQPDGEGGTVLYGPITDQAALHGLLTKIRDLNLKLVSVNRIDKGQVATDGGSAAS